LGREVVQMLAARGATDVTASHPRMTLETLFLRVTGEGEPSRKK